MKYKRFSYLLILVLMLVVGINETYAAEAKVETCNYLTADKTANMPAISKVTLTGKEFTTNKIVGVQGEDGRSSGNVSTNVAGSKMVMMSTCGVAVWAPFRSFIILEA